jgi:hypothetical protein
MFELVTLQLTVLLVDDEIYVMEIIEVGPILFPLYRDLTLIKWLVVF